MSRAELLVPEGWAPRIGSTVAILPHRDDPVPAPGAWRVVDRAPEPSHWWITPVDDLARSWADAHPQRVTSRCLAMPSRRLVPPGHRPRPKPSPPERRMHA